MFGLIVAIAALAAPVTPPAMADRIAGAVSDDVLETDLVGLWYFAFVSPDGTIEKCNVIATVGDRTAAGKVCDEIVGRKVTPAVGLQGEPAYGSFIGSVSLAENFDGMPGGLLPPDLTVLVTSGANGRASINVAIGADGKVLACEPNGASNPLSGMACDEASRLGFPVETAKNGEPVAYTRPMIVQFELDRG